MGLPVALTNSSTTTAPTLTTTIDSPSHLLWNWLNTTTGIIDPTQPHQHQQQRVLGLLLTLTTITILGWLAHLSKRLLGRPEEQSTLITQSNSTTTTAASASSSSTSTTTTSSTTISSTSNITSQTHTPNSNSYTHTRPASTSQSFLNQFQLDDDSMDTIMNTTPQTKPPTIPNSNPNERSRPTFPGINTNVLTLRSHALANIPSSPVSPMLEADSQQQQQQVPLTAKELMQTIQAQANNNKDSTPYQEDAIMTDATSLLSSHHTSPAHNSTSSTMEEQMSRDEDDLEPLAAAHPPIGWDHSQTNLGTTDDVTSFEGEEMEEYEEVEESPESKQTDGATAAIPLTREERLAQEEKDKSRKKFAEMRYLVNSMYRCQDCTIAPTDMELGFEEHAPPRRPAAKPSAGPGSEFCCVGPALAEALPPDFPIDLIPIAHSYLLTEAPTRSFLTTPPLPSQGTIQCYILKTNTKFELYLEMKSQETFVKMRQAKAEHDRKYSHYQQQKEAGSSTAPPLSADDQEMKDENEQQRDFSTSSSLPSNAPILLQSQSMPIPVTSLDDSELEAKTPPLEDEQPNSLDTPAGLYSPTHSLDYEKLFPERTPIKKKRRLVRSAQNTPELKSRGTTTSNSPTTNTGRLGAASAAANGAGPRRMSEPVLFNLGPSHHNSRSVASTPQLRSRRLSGASSTSSAAIMSAAMSAALPPSAANLHLHNTRTNAINTMLKNHAETIISQGNDIFLLCAQRKRSWTGNHYIISNDRDNIKAEGPSFFGKLKSNFGGTEFTCTDNGTKSPSRRCMEKLQTHMYPTYSSAAPKEQHKQTMASWLSGTNATQPHIKHELACVLYDHFFEHTGSPIRIKVLLPNRAFDLATEAAVGGSIIKQYKAECERNEKRKLEAEAKAAAAEEQRKKLEAKNEHYKMQLGDQMTDVNDQNEGGANSQHAASSSSSSGAVAPAMNETIPNFDSECSIETYENLRPVWHDGMNAYVLHFDHHRVREKSVKNFKLVRTVPDPNSKTPGATIQKTVLQFGRVLDRNVFVMDYAYPLSPLAAFAICLSSIDPKLAV